MVMSSIGDLAFGAAVSMAPVIVLTTFVLLLVIQQPRWVTATVVACGVVAATAFVSYWYLWGKAFDYADANRSVPAAIDQALNVALAACVLSSLVVVALGGSRLVIAWSDRSRSGLAPIPW